MVFMKKIKIFISSVQKEFKDLRQDIVQYIRFDALFGKFFEPYIFEEAPANAASAKEVYLSEVKKCDIYLGLLGRDYGYEDKNGLSPTEQEYDLATALSKTRLIFIKNVSDRQKKEIEFIKKVENDITRKTFSDREMLLSAIYSSLIKYLETKEIIRSMPFDASYDTDATIADLDFQKIKNFIHMAREKRAFPLAENTPVEVFLKHLDLISDDNKVSNAAILLFGKKVQKYFLSSQVKCAQFYGTKVEKPIPSYQIYQGDVFELVDKAVNFVMSRIDISVGLRDAKNTASVETQPELPIHAVQEAIVNAICHRDYTSNASVQVMLFKDRLEIWNPGHLPEGMTIKKLLEPHKSIPVNPLLATPMFWNGYIEQAGTGTEDIVEQCTKMELKKPIFNQDEDFRVVIYRQNATVNATVNDLDKVILEKIKENPKTTLDLLADALDKHRATISRHVTDLQVRGLLLREGSDKNGFWKVK